jgi:transcription antitermination factor NusG
VDDEAIESLRLRQGERGYVIPELPPRAVRPGTRVRIAVGAMAGLEGVVTRYLPAKRRVQLLLRSVTAARGAEGSARCLGAAPTSVGLAG